MRKAVTDEASDAVDEMVRLSSSSYGESAESIVSVSPMKPADCGDWLSAAGGWAGSAGCDIA
jgi:hypothetical protein